MDKSLQQGILWHKLQWFWKDKQQKILQDLNLQSFVFWSVDSGSENVQEDDQAEQIFLKNQLKFKCDRNVRDLSEAFQKLKFC